MKALFSGLTADLSKKQKKWLRRILLSGLLFLPLLILSECGIFDFPYGEFLALLLFLLPYLLIGHDILYKAFRNILRGQIFDECFLMVIATLGALIVGFLPGAESEIPEAVGVMLFYQVGEFFQSVAVGRSRRSIADLMALAPDTANLETDSGIETVDPAEIGIGSVIVVRPGEKIPLDGLILSGTSALNTVALTGESMPRDVSEGDSVLSGCINLSGLLRVRTTKEFGESTVSKILELVEHATESKARSEEFITKFARYYTPFIVFSALAVAILPPLFLGGSFLPWIVRALTFLVISCPCALVISVPLSFFGGIGGASKCGILIKGSSGFDLLAKAKTVAFDKTGTLTKGSFRLRSILSAPDSGLSENALLALASEIEAFSSHPIAESIREEARVRGILSPEHTNAIEERAGMGIAMTEPSGEIYYAGNEKLMKELGLSLPDDLPSGTAVHIARSCSKEGRYLGSLIIADELREHAKEAIEALYRIGIETTVMLTGDRKEAALETAAALSITDCRYELFPEDKVGAVEELLSASKKKGSVLFVGDGINDAPVLARADIGFALGGLGSDAAIEAADVVLMDDDPGKIALTIRIAKRTVGIVYQNIFFALLIKLLVLILAALGLASMWLAVFADVGVAALAILNAMRAMSVKKLLRK